MSIVSKGKPDAAQIIYLHIRETPLFSKLGSGSVENFNCFSATEPDGRAVFYPLNNLSIFKLGGSHF